MIDPSALLFFRGLVRRLGVFSALRHRDYRLYWSGAVVSFTGSWVQTVCLGWLVYDLTGSKLWLGLVGFAGTVPVSLLIFFGGVIADRIDQRRAIIITQTLLSASALTLGILTYTGMVNRYHILILALVQGTVLAFDSPLRLSMPARLVPKQDLTNAIVLNATAFNVARIAGPAVAGVLADRLGMSVCFFVNAMSYVPVIAAIRLMKTPTPASHENGGTSVMSEVIEGLRCVMRDPRMSRLVVVLMFSSIFIAPYITLMPIFARDVLKVGVAGNGALFASVGIGAIVGALFLARFTSTEHQGRILSVSAACVALIMIAFANSGSFALSKVLLAGLGFMFVCFNQTSHSIIQHSCDDRFRGRAISAYLFAMGGVLPLGNLQAGALAETIGAPMTLSIGGAIFLCSAIYLATQRRILALEPEHSVETLEEEVEICLKQS